MIPLYYVLRYNGEAHRIVRQYPKAVFCGWKNGEWVEMPGLAKIVYDNKGVMFPRTICIS